MSQHMPQNTALKAGCHGYHPYYPLGVRATYCIRGVLQRGPHGNGLVLLPVVLLFLEQYHISNTGGRMEELGRWKHWVATKIKVCHFDLVS